MKTKLLIFILCPSTILQMGVLTIILIMTTRRMTIRIADKGKGKGEGQGRKVLVRKGFQLNFNSRLDLFSKEG